MYHQILELFSKEHNLKLTNDILKSIEDETNGGNLIFLTLLLLSWRDLIYKNNKFSFNIDVIRNHSHSIFLELYDSHHTDNWKYINHVVSALFQYEIRIDKRYLSPENDYFVKYEIENYLRDKLIHYKRVYDEQNRLFFVFMDFAEGEEANMMRHAAEFRFYLEAYKNNLSFASKNYLDRMEFTKLVLDHYISFKPCNIEEVIKRIYSNARNEELKILHNYLKNNLSTKELIKKYRKEVLSKSM